MSNFVELAGSSGVVCLCLCPKMMSDGQYYGHLSFRYISHSGKHVGHRLDLDQFDKGRDDWRCRSGAQVGSVELRRVQNRAPVQIPSSWLSSAHCTPTAQRCTRSRHWMSAAGPQIMTGPNLALAHRRNSSEQMERGQGHTDTSHNQWQDNNYCVPLHSHWRWASYSWTF